MLQKTQLLHWDGGKTCRKGLKGYRKDLNPSNVWLVVHLFTFGLIFFLTDKYRNHWFLWLRIGLSSSRVCMIVLNWIVYCPRFVRMTQHWVGWVCAEFGWNWLRFGSKYYSNTWFYMSVCLCFATCVTLVTGLFIFVVCPCRLLLRQAGTEKNSMRQRDV